MSKPVDLDDNIVSNALLIRDILRALEADYYEPGFEHDKYCRARDNTKLTLVSNIAEDESISTYGLSRNYFKRYYPSLWSRIEFYEFKHDLDKEVSVDASLEGSDDDDF